MRNNNLPLLANGWQWRKFGDCARLINGRAYSQEELLDSGTPVLRIQNLNGGDRWYYSNLTLPEEKYCEAGDLLYAWSASFGPYRFAGPKSIFHYHIWRVLPGDELDKGFTFRLLDWVTARIKAAAHGVAMLHMTKAGMEAWPIPLPPLPEQRRIAEVLDRAEALRVKRRAALAQLDTLTQAIFLDLFGDPATNPKGWPIKQLGETMAEVYRYPTYYDITYEESGVPEIRGELLREDGSIVMDKERLRFISPMTSARFPRTVLAEGDLVMSVRGTIGKIGLVPPALAGANITANLIRMAPDRSVLDPTFAWHFTQSSSFQGELAKACSSTTILTIKAPDLKRLVIPLPPVPLQREFAHCVAAVEKLKTAHRASLAELDTLFASLQHRAFQGEL